MISKSPIRAGAAKGIREGKKRGGKNHGGRGDCARGEWRGENLA